MRSDHTLLNVVRSQGPGKSIDAALIDNLETKPGSVIAASGVFADPTTFYSEDDFDIGKTISIAGRDVLLHDCDNFTREYFRNTRNKLLEPLALQQKVEKKTEKEVFPFTGFGSEEDSKASCQHTLEPRAPQRDFFKFMHKDRHGFDSHILRFSARLIHEDKVDVKRKFVIAYFLSDDTILVTLMPEQNSGRHGGRFMKRTKMRKPVGNVQLSIFFPFFPNYFPEIFFPKFSLNFFPIFFHNFFPKYVSKKFFHNFFTHIFLHFFPEMFLPIFLPIFFVQFFFDSF